MNVFDLTCFQCSKIVTQRYSTSFSLGIRTLHPSLRSSIYAIYGFVRYADEIVDTFFGYPQADLLNKFREDTYLALEQRISMNPILHTFQQTVHRYTIEADLIEAFLQSMAMDLHQQSYSTVGYKAYIYGSAEVVGLMCLRVFCQGDDELYRQLKAPARRLGAAFQKVNFLRDIQSDYRDRGRTYFPGVDFEQFDQSAKQRIETDIQADFEVAYQGIVRLPSVARWGVYLAYRYYLRLFKKIRGFPAATIVHQRIRIHSGQKIVLLLGTYAQHWLNLKLTK